MKLVAAAVMLGLGFSALPADARVQREMICWVPDCEFPVDCDAEE